MERIITYKKQGNGLDSWIIQYVENGQEVKCREVVYEDPNMPAKKLKIDNIDIDSITKDDLQRLAQKLKPFLK